MVQHFRQDVQPDSESRSNKAYPNSSQITRGPYIDRNRMGVEPHTSLRMGSGRFNGPNIGFQLKRQTIERLSTIRISHINLWTPPLPLEFEFK
jgi:hypothetical protein